MTFAKLEIWAERDRVGNYQNVFSGSGLERKLPEIMFNPSEISFEKKGWNQKDNQALAPTDELMSLNLNLFFDTTLTGYPPDNVQLYTRKIVNLTEKLSGSDRPPLCQIKWGMFAGQGSFIMQQGVLLSVTKQLTHFIEDGTPVRARLNCQFREYQSQDKKAKIQNPIDDPIHVVRQGETLISIAAQEYNDPTLWRLIADANNLKNPRGITPGQVLTILPKPTEKRT
ncbi:LysM peptidoglycan-binding domain-containing protein [Nostoc parmelioides]|uniref:LysM peptidoglycan-binding domain-containing protein n=1 Tax=Nostoc parmelioides FACHB-3921 TaxID=2692909 RepID=A0ABR8BD02_9NOSO|nr:LysM peptidoglycan-binding domain-containing protein [Nostoc parmelioides]MBD2251982.1 LysM peptidoglycan-binding domain-containing protein [Nostoc parmelioides FACHB-3921]